mgnify:CR=1 FL=1
MNNQTLDEFLVERTAQKMKRIEPEINKEVAEWICEYFGSGNAADLTEDQIPQVKDAQEVQELGILKLGYNQVLKQLHQ